MLARLKTEIQEVWRYDGGTMPTWVWDYLEYRDSELYLVRRSGKQRVEFGEWLIRDSGDPLWMTHEEFQRDYEIVGD